MPSGSQPLAVVTHFVTKFCIADKLQRHLASSFARIGSHGYAWMETIMKTRTFIIGAAVAAVTLAAGAFGANAQMRGGYGGGYGGDGYGMMGGYGGGYGMMGGNGGGGYYGHMGYGGNYERGSGPRGGYGPGYRWQRGTQGYGGPQYQGNGGR